MNTLLLKCGTMITCSSHLLLLFLLDTRVAADDTELVRAALVANHATLEAFAAYKCRYTVTRAVAESEASALKGSFRDRRSCDFVLVVDGSKVKFESLGPRSAPTPPKNRAGQNAGKRSVSAEFVASADLRLNGRVLRYFPPFQNAAVHGVNVPDQNERSPLSMECVAQRPADTPMRVFLNGGGRDAVVSGRGLTELEGKPVIHVQGKALSLDFEYYFDPTRGYLPVKFVRHVEPPWSAEKADIIVHLLSARECKGGRWYPMTWLELWKAASRPQVDVLELRVSELDVDNKPTDKDFAIVMAAGTSVEAEARSAREPATSFRLRQDETVRPEDIPRLARMLEESSRVPLMDTAVHSGKAFAWWQWCLIGGGVFVMACAFLVYRRRRLSA